MIYLESQSGFIDVKSQTKEGLILLARFQIPLLVEALQTFVKSVQHPETQLTFIGGGLAAAALFFFAELDSISREKEEVFSSPELHVRTLEILSLIHQMAPRKGVDASIELNPPLNENEKEDEEEEESGEKRLIVSAQIDQGPVLEVTNINLERVLMFLSRLQLGLNIGKLGEFWKGIESDQLLSSVWYLFAQSIVLEKHNSFSESDQQEIEAKFSSLDQSLTNPEVQKWWVSYNNIVFVNNIMIQAAAETIRNLITNSKKNKGSKNTFSLN
jgi:hypothetical protein